MQLEFQGIFHKVLDLYVNTQYCMFIEQQQPAHEQEYYGSAPAQGTQ